MAASLGGVPLGRKESFEVHRPKALLLRGRPYATLTNRQLVASYQRWVP